MPPQECDLSATLVDIPTIGQNIASQSRAHRVLKDMFTTLRNILCGLPRPVKRSALILFDMVALSIAAWAAYSLRLSTWFIPTPTQWIVIAAAPLASIPVFVRFGLYRAVIRYLPERALWTIANAVIVSTLVWVCLLFAMEFSRLGTVPRSVPVIYCLLAIIAISGSRFAAKYMLWAPIRRRYSGQVAIYGAGNAGAQLASALQRENNKYVAGFLDDDPALQGRDVAGIRVYAPHQLPHLMETTGVKEIILSMPSIESSRRQKIVADLSHHQIKIRALPAIADLASGKYLVSQIREIDIDDILGRSSVPADPQLLQSMIEGRAILVSGAGGSIGSELCRLIAKWNPRKLVLLEASEYSLYQIERNLSKRGNITIIPVLGSVKDDALVRNTLKAEGVQVVFHAAAHKHVPLVEANVIEGIRNNVFGTKVIAEASFEAGVENFVLISTDKAVRPTNVMGATKRWAELIVHQLAERAKQENSGQKFCAVRFGNVLGSNGSVVPLFKEQIVAGGPVTVTDEEMTRYFMSIHEAAELIVQAGALSKGGDIFLLEMGEPVRIRDLAENMIRLAGLRVRDSANPTGDIGISIIGRRPGEKTHEELFYDPDNAKPTRQPKILRATGSKQQNRDVTANLADLFAALEEGNDAIARLKLFAGIDEKTERNSPQVVPINRAKNG